MALLDPADVRNFLPQADFSADQLDVTMALVAGWLTLATGTAVTGPLPETDPLWPPALELVALVASNPESLASKTRGPTSSTWPLAARRDAILAEVRRTAGTGLAPRGTFPQPCPWPDRARGGPTWYDPVTDTWWTQA